MTIQIALLRAINVGGRNKIAMAELRAMLDKLGFANARTLIQSGNVVFEGGRECGAKLEVRLEAETEKRFKVRPDYCVRSAKEWDAIVTTNPFPKDAKADPAHLVVMALKSAPSADAVRVLQAAIKGREVVRANGRELYIVYPDGIGDSKLTPTLIEAKLATRGTARNWNTVLKLAAMAAE